MRRARSFARALVWVAALAGAVRADGSAEIVSRTVAVHGVRLHYLEAGAGPPLVLLHGLGGSAESLRPLLPALAERRRVVALDMVGFGGSDKPDLDYRPEDFLRFLDRFLEAIEAPRAAILGQSMGGRIASLLALRHPERVERLILVDGLGYRPELPPDVRRILSPASVADMKRQLELLFHDDARYATQEAAARSYEASARSRARRTIAKVLKSFDRGEGFAGSLAGIRAPTLILWGRQDEISPVSLAERAHREIAGSRLVVIDGCGHLPHVEARERFEAEVLEFLGQRDPSIRVGDPEQ